MNAYWINVLYIPDPKTYPSKTGDVVLVGGRDIFYGDEPEDAIHVANEYFNNTLCVPSGYRMTLEILPIRKPKETDLISIMGQVNAMDDAARGDFDVREGS